jgi:3-phosphoglycerate kinase
MFDGAVTGGKKPMAAIVVIQGLSRITVLEALSTSVEVVIIGGGMTSPS